MDRTVRSVKEIHGKQRLDGGFGKKHCISGKGDINHICLNQGGVYAG